MLLADAGSSVLPTDIIDGGSTSTPPTDIYDSAFLMVAQVTSAGMLTPTFSQPSSTEVITRQPGQLLVVRIGATATTVTVQVPGQQPYTNAERDDSTSGSVSNTERNWYLAPVLVDSTDSVVVLYSQTTAVTAALLQVG